MAVLPSGAWLLLRLLPVMRSTSIHS
jgi:hypothetical protein